MPLPSTIDWVRTGSRKPDALAAPSPLLSSAGLYTGIRLASTEAPAPGELPEGRCHAPLVFVCLSRHLSEACRAGRWTERRFEPGDITVTPPGMPVAYRWSEPNRGILVELDPDLLPGRLDVRPAFAGKDPLLVQMVLALRDELQAGNPAGPMYSEMLGAALKAHFVRKHTVNDTVPSDSRSDLERSRLRAVLEYIDAHLHDPISLTDLGRIAEMGVFQLAHAFKRRMGIPPHQYLLRKRVERAIQFMRDANASIVDIAFRCGFSSQSHLVTVFRRVTGTTPAAYRAQMRRRAEPPATAPRLEQP